MTMTDEELNDAIARRVMQWTWDDWEPSQSIAQAWLVIEKLCEQWPDVGVSRTETGWGCSWGMDGAGWNWVEADTAPKAICLAALLAIGVDVGIDSPQP